MSVTETSALWCSSCEDTVDELTDLFSCSRCGGEHVASELDDPDSRPARCPDCNVFMSTLERDVCPDCHDPDATVEEKQMWDAGGQLFLTRAEAVQWLKDAPKREKARKKSEAKMRADQDRRNKERGAANAELLPKMKALLAHLDPASQERLHQTLTRNVETLERDIEEWTFSASLYFPEMAALLAPELEAELALAGDYDADYDDRRAAEAVIQARFGELIEHPELRDRMVDVWYTYGTGLGVSIEATVDGLLSALLATGHVPS